MSNEHKVHLRGATVTEGERIKATSLELQYKNIWVRSMCFIHINKEQNIATPLNAIGIPIVPEEFEPPINLVQKYRKWFTKAMKEQMKFFEQNFYSNPITYQYKDKNGNVTKEWSVDPKSLKHSFGSLESYMDNFYHDSIKLHKCENYRDWAEHVMQGCDEATIDTYAKQCEKEREERIKNAKELNPRYSGLDK